MFLFNTPELYSVPQIFVEMKQIYMNAKHHFSSTSGHLAQISQSFVQYRDERGLKYKCGRKMKNEKKACCASFHSIALFLHTALFI